MVVGPPSVGVTRDARRLGAGYQPSALWLAGSRATPQRGGARRPRRRNVRYCFYPARYVLSLDPKENPTVRVLSETYLPHLDEENVY